MQQLQLIELEGNIVFAQPFNLDGALQIEKTLKLDGSVIIGGGGQTYPYYEGEYIVTPLAFEQTILDTDEKVMRDDVTVLEVPYNETSNEYGTTVSIATL